MSFSCLERMEESKGRRKSGGRRCTETGRGEERRMRRGEEFPETAAGDACKGAARWSWRDAC